MTDKVTFSRMARAIDTVLSLYRQRRISFGASWSQTSMLVEELQAGASAFHVLAGKEKRVREVVRE